MDEIVKIKGTREGLIVLLDESADFQDLLRRLAERIADSNGFLDGSAVSIDVGPRDLQSGQMKLSQGNSGREKHGFAPDYSRSEAPQSAGR